MRQEVRQEGSVRTQKLGASNTPSASASEVRRRLEGSRPLKERKEGRNGRKEREGAGKEEKGKEGKEETEGPERNGRKG